MPSLLIRNLDESVKRALRRRAAAHGRSMEAEARLLLRQALAEKKEKAPEVGLGTWIHSIAMEVGGFELELPKRSPVREPPSFD
jgi:plasmid stability protein